MKATKYLVMAAAALAFAACSNEELASVAPKNKSGLKPLEFSTIVQAQTRAQIDASNLTTLYMTTTGTFYDADNVKVTDPTLTLTKSGSDWTYTYNDNTTPSDLFWPLEGTSATFKAWYYDGGSAAGALNNKNADKDAVGAYAAINYVEGEQTVSLSMYHAVAKAEFKVKVHSKEQGNNKVKIDVKSVCLHNMNYKASAYTAPTSETLMGAFTVDGTTHRDLLTPIDGNYTPSFITEGDDAVDKGSLFVLPQTFTVQDLTATSWTKPYISVLAQICIDKDGDSDPVIFPKSGASTDYAWIALPLPSDFTGMVAHKKYVFTINFRNDALGKVDRDQNPNGEDKNGDGEEPNETDDDPDDEPSGPNTNDKVPDGDEGSDIKLGDHSGYALKVTVTTVDDFGEGGAYDVANIPSSSGGGGTKMAAEATGADVGNLICTDGHIHVYGVDAGCTKERVAMIAYVGTESDCTHGLAIALEDVSDNTLTWESTGTNNNNKTAAEWCSAWNTSSKAVTGYTWRLPSQKDWQYMFIGCGSGESYANPSDWGERDYSYLATKLGSVSGTALHGNNDFYWSSTTKDSGQGAWMFMFKNTNNIAYFVPEVVSQGLAYHYVRACLNF